MIRQRGLTLLELLIAMVLLGFIVTLLFAGFRLASRAWDSVDTHAQRTADEQLARAALRRIVTTLQPVRWRKGVNQPLAFVGEPTRLRAIGPLTAQGEAAGLRVFELAVASASADGEATQRLTLRQAPPVWDAEAFGDPLADAADQIVLDGLTAARFAYFGSDDGRAPARWHDAWPDAGRMPALVRISLQSADAGWQDVVAAPTVMGGNCTLDLAFKLRCT